MPAARRRAQVASTSASTSVSELGWHCATITDRPATVRMIVSASRTSTPPVSAPTASASTSAAAAGTSREISSQVMPASAPTC